MLSDWVIYLALGSFILGVLVGTFIRYGIDQAELACYRHISRRLKEED